MAEVYRAKVLSGPKAGWFVALKRLSPSLSANPTDVDRFTREARLSQRLDHPHIIKVFETGVIGSTYFIATELVDGTDLARLLRRCRAGGIQLPVDFAVYLAKVLLDALAYAHRGLKIVHCDVSPSNLFISRTGEIKLGDFGVARLWSGRREDGEVRGKAPYLSPEAMDGKVTPAADLWASNVTLYELLTLERPFAAETGPAVLDAIRQGRYRSLRELRPEVTVALAGIVDRGFSSEASARFRTAEKFAQALALHFDERVGNPMAIAAVVRGLFGANRA